MALNPSLQPQIGPDGLPREAPVIAYTEKVHSLQPSRARIMNFCSAFICFLNSSTLRGFAFFLFFFTSIPVADNRGGAASIEKVPLVSPPAFPCSYFPNSSSNTGE